MCPSKSLRFKNLIELWEIKNYKTKKFKQRLKHNQWLYFNYQYQYHQHHDFRTYKFQCKSSHPPSYVNSFIINQIIDSSSSFNICDISQIQVISALKQSIISAFKMSIIPTSCFKMSLIFVLFLSIIASHIANCQAIYERDNTILFLSNISYYKNTRNLENFKNKSLIAVKSKITNYSESTSAATLKFIEINDDKLWLRRSYQKPESVNITPEIKIPQGQYKMYRHNQNLLRRNQFLPISNSTYEINRNDNKKLLKIVMEGLGLQTLPDFKKANISQLEYSTKYNEYLDRVRKRAITEFDKIFNQLHGDDTNTSISLLSIRHNSSETKFFRERRSPSKNKNKTLPFKSVLLKFPLELNNEGFQASDIVEANMRLLLMTNPALATFGKSKRRRKHHHSRQKHSGIHNHNERHRHTNVSTSNDGKPDKNFGKPETDHFLNLKVYQLLEPKGKVRIDRLKIKIKLDDTTSQWIQFDVTKAVEDWLVNKKKNLGFEIQCDNCFRNGARIIEDLAGESDVSITDKYEFAPVLNIIGRLGIHREKRSKHYHNQMTGKTNRKVLKNNCYKDNQRCCRHSMEVVFKEIKGFEFIIQPKVFDAGYCWGRCPPRYNPAHHHALLQSLIWKQDKQKVPRPCCAPSKLLELEVLHLDERDNEKLKISKWTDMQVLECACS